MTAVECFGHEWTVLNSISAAALGEAGSCGQNHTMSGLCACNHFAMNWALNERGLERKPCAYTMCVVFAGVNSEVAWVKKSLPSEYRATGNLIGL